MDEREFCENLLDLKSPWTVWKVVLDRDKHTLDIFVDHPKGIKFPCPECGMESIVYDHQRERIWRDKDKSSRKEETQKGREKIGKNKKIKGWNMDKEK